MHNLTDWIACTNCYYTSCGALVVTRNRALGGVSLPSSGFAIMTQHILSGCTQEYNNKQMKCDN